MEGRQGKGQGVISETAFDIFQIEELNQTLDERKQVRAQRVHD